MDALFWPKVRISNIDAGSGDEAAIFAAGDLMLEGEEKPLLPAVLEVLSPHAAILTITEGRYHQVRRMFAAVGNHVEALHRLSVGGLVLPEGLEAGEFCVLDGAARAAVLGEAAGGVQ